MRKIKVTEKEKELMDKMKDELGFAAFKELADTTKRLGIMEAIIKTNGSKDFKVLAQNIYENKKGMVEMEILEAALAQHYPILVEQKHILEDGTLSMEATIATMNYLTFLSGKTIAMDYDDEEEKDDNEDYGGMPPLGFIIGQG